ncbi:MAG: M14 family metallopeptidase [bacterium]|nr:M14 family metallopeptidase [bacterium]
MLRNIFVFMIIIFTISTGLLSARPDLVTVAERSNFEKTSGYEDVMSFLFEAQKRSDKIRVITLTTSTEGRTIPLAILSSEGVKSPLELRLTGKPALLIMANIHAGEVEGKEATQMLIREIITGKMKDILQNQVILIIPIFNVDGNDKFGKNRRDNGPELAGVRHNGQRLDLNRDGIKLESPEMRGLVRLFNQWDPVLFVDMHTTNGSYHREPVTYTTLLNPNSDPQLSDYMWRKFFPAVSETLKKKFGYDAIPYGNFTDRSQPGKGWRSHAFGARYATNYFGLRNRFTVLDENYSHADFKTRVLSSFGFIKAIVLYTGAHIREMQEMVHAADRKTKAHFHNENFTLEYKNEKLMELTIKSYEFTKEKIKPELLDKYPRWYNGFIVKKTDVLKDYKVDYFSKAVPVKTLPMPEAYIILPHNDNVVKTLKNHGIIVERIRKSFKAPVENFEIDKLELDKRLYQGHVFVTVKGHYVKKEVNIPENAYFISMKQPLARLLPVMLEPECEDSFVVWGFFDRILVRQWSGRLNSYPVYRLNKIDIAIERYQE